MSPTLGPTSEGYGAGGAVKGVFDTKPGSGYDDRIEERYHFPATAKYMAVAQAVLGDWIVYREPQRNGGRRAYIGAARVVAIEPDRRLSESLFKALRDAGIDDPAPRLRFSRLPLRR